MKKRLTQLMMVLCLFCLWISFSGSTLAIRLTVPFSYECGEWAGKTCGTYQSTDGSGTLTFDHGGTYTGSVLSGHPSGSGTYTFANGECVSGSFSWSDGTSYVMEKSKSGNTPHYEGTDMVYVGMMKNGEPCGFGELDFQDGGTFYGEFLDGTVKGKGVYVYREPDSTTEVTGSDWSMVNRVPSSLGGRWYSGLVSGKTWQGYGMLCYNYSYYIGEVLNNYCHGHGTYWQWSQNGDPSGTLTRKDYGHYNTGGLHYTCTHGSKQTVCDADASATVPGASSSGGSSSNGLIIFHSNGPTNGSGTITETCSKCNGSGACTSCSGNGRRNCTSSQCNNGTCTKCNGRGYYIYLGKLSPCFCTLGRCHICNGRGYLECRACGGSGKCSLCGG